MDGLLIISKEKGLTSRDVVNIACRKLNTHHIGHAGTLDPIASGVLVLCINRGTKLIELLTCNSKEYIASVQLGIKTDSLDITGSVLEEQKNYKIDKSKINSVLESFIGTYEQEVPLYSAIQVNGKRLYKYAREKKEVVLPTRQVEIYDITLIDFEDRYFTFKVSVSKGTYIRSLIRDIGTRLQIPCTMTELIRIRSGKFKIEDSILVSEIDESKIIPINKVLDDYNQVIVDDEIKKKIINGAKLDNIYHQDMVVFIDSSNQVLAIYKKNDFNELVAYKVFS